MTTRREVLTGLAALPIGATAPDLEGKAAAEPTDRPAPPVFVHALDKDIFQELEIMERLIAKMKTELLSANSADPITRSAFLFIMRCSPISASADYLKFAIIEQREHAAEQEREWRSRQEAVA